MTLSQRDRLNAELAQARRDEFHDHSAFVHDQSVVRSLLRRIGLLDRPRPLLLVDVSDYQGDINFAALKRSGIAGIIAKATEGLTIADGHFARNMGLAHNEDMYRGAYHFARPQPGRTGAQEADHFLQAVGGHLGRGTLIPWLDIEVTQLGRNETIGWVHDFARHIWDSRRWRTGLYTYQMFLNWPPMGMPLWLANYGVSNWPILQGFARPVIWQYTSSGRRPGISGPIDLNHTETHALASVTIP